jgi:hypothetical protein
MRTSPYPSLIVLLTVSCLPHAGVIHQNSVMGTKSASPTRSSSYDNTVRMLKQWVETEDNEQLIPLFALGDSRSSDLLYACRNENDETANVALLTLQLLGSIDCQPCADSFSKKHDGPVIWCAVTLTEKDFQRIDAWWARTRTSKGYECGDEEAGRLDDALIYALILEGSPRSVSVLKRMLELEKACAGYETINGDLLERAPSMVIEAKKIGHNLQIEPGTLEETIRNAAFFIPSEHRQDSTVTLLARNSTDTRMLLEVSYRCGGLCGSGYAVVLRKDGNVWQYALVRMMWIS